MADVAVNVYGPAEPSTSDDTSTFAAPSGELIIVRSIHVSNPTGSAATFTLAKTASGTSANCFFEAFSVPAGNTFDWSGFLVIEDGETWYIKQGTSTALTVTASGVEVS
jgi:hypothetical protein